MSISKQTGDSRKYFAAYDEENFAARLLSKVQEAPTDGITQAVRNLLARAYLYYYGFDNDAIHGTAMMSRGGEVGELAKIRVNHARAVVNTLLNLVIAERVVYEPRATNVDYESLRQVKVAKAVLEYYWSETGVEQRVYAAVEEGIAFSEGFVLGLWDEFAGEDVDEIDPAVDPESIDPEKPGAVKAKKSGDFTFENVSTWNVFRDASKPSWEALDWVAVRVWRNKFDLAARYPEYENEILDSGAEEFLLNETSNARTPQTHRSNDDIPVLLFFHKRTPALPQGREAMVLGNKTVLRDGGLTYENIPLFRVRPSDLVGTPYAYTPYFEILAIQELIDSLETTVASNLTTFGTQNIWLPHGTEVQESQVSGALRILQANNPEAKEPKALQLCSTPAELYKHLEEKKRDLEMVFGVNAVVRGQVESDKQSGAALALLSTQAKQQSSSLHGAYRFMIQRIGAFIIEELRKRATVPRKIDIVGKDSAFLVVSEEPFTGADFGAIKRVLIDLGNPLSQTVYGRAEMAKELVAMNLVTNLEQYFQVLDTGRTEPITESLTSELLLIKAENEMIGRGETPQAMLHDNHLLHGREHRTPVASPQARQNPEVLKADMDHMHQHYEAYFGVPAMQPQVDMMTGQPVVDPRTGQQVMMPDPMYRTRMLILMGLQPPDPALAAPGSMPMPGMPPGGAPPGGAPPSAPPPAGGPPSPPPDAPKPPGTEPGQGAKPPSMPELPVNKETGKQWSPSDGTPN